MLGSRQCRDTRQLQYKCTQLSLKSLPRSIDEDIKYYLYAGVPITGCLSHIGGDILSPQLAFSPFLHTFMDIGSAREMVPELTVIVSETLVLGSSDTTIYNLTHIHMKDESEKP